MWRERVFNARIIGLDDHTDSYMYRWNYMPNSLFLLSYLSEVSNVAFPEWRWQRSSLQLDASDYFAWIS